MLVLNIYTIILAILLSFFLYFKTEKTTLNRILAFIFVLPVFAFGINTTQLLGLAIPNNQFYLLAGYIFPYLFAPAVYCYIELLCGQKTHWKFPLFSLTALLLTTILILSIHSLFLTDEKKYQLTNELRSGTFPLEMLVLNSIFFISQLLYFTISTIRVARFKKSLKNNLSETEKTRISYADIFIKLIWILNGTLLVFYTILPLDTAEYIASPVLYMVFYGFVAYYGMKYNVIFYFDDRNPFRRNLYLNDDEEKERFAELIISHLEQSKSYLNPEYSLTDLAKDINTFPTKVSQAINQELNKNFSDLINSYRIETAKQILLEEKHLSVEGAALNSGFNSRATFYRVFKKHTGLSPIDYLNSVEQQ